MIEMDIESIRVSLLNSQRVILLKEKTGERYLPIWIGPSEADAIAIRLQGIKVSRPLTHDLLNSIINALGGKLKSVIINELRNDTFYARINLMVNGRRVEVNCRPSDALALAIRAGTPVLVNETVINSAGISLEKEAEKPVTSEDMQTEVNGVQSDVNKQISPEELKQLSAYTDFFNTLDMDGLE